MSTKRGGLGTNLDSLIPTTLTVNEEVVATQNEIPVEQISPNPRQPRTVFDEDALNELIASIKEIGILQPPVVRQTTPGKYELEKTKNDVEKATDKSKSLQSTIDDLNKQVDFLRNNACYLVQGYYFSMPLAEQELARLNFETI